MSFITRMTSTFDDSFKQFWLLMLSGYVPHCSTVAAQDSYVECECQSYLKGIRWNRGSWKILTFHYITFFNMFWDFPTSGILKSKTIWKTPLFDKLGPSFSSAGLSYSLFLVSPPPTPTHPPPPPPPPTHPGKYRNLIFKVNVHSKPCPYHTRPNQEFIGRQLLSKTTS